MGLDKPVLYLKFMAKKIIEQKKQAQHNADKYWCCKGKVKPEILFFYLYISWKWAQSKLAAELPEQSCKNQSNSCNYKNVRELHFEKTASADILIAHSETCQAINCLGRDLNPGPSISSVKMPENAGILASKVLDDWPDYTTEAYVLWRAVK